jgi:hypothetical protein
MKPTAKKRSFCIVVVILMSIFGTLSGVRAEDCATLKRLEKNALNDYLQKKLSLEISNKTSALIKAWRGEYNASDLLSTQLSQVNARIGQEQIAAEQAELRYFKALDDRKQGCSGD